MEERAKARADPMAMPRLAQLHEMRLKMSLEVCCIAVGLLGAIFFGAGLYATAQGGLFGMQGVVVALGVATLVECVGGLLVPKSQRDSLKFLVFYGALVLALASFFVAGGTLFFKDEFLHDVNVFWEDVGYQFPSVYPRNDTVALNTARSLVVRHCNTVGVTGMLNVLALAGVALFAGMLQTPGVIARVMPSFNNLTLLALGIVVTAWAGRATGDASLAAQAPWIGTSLWTVGILLLFTAALGLYVELLVRRAARLPEDEAGDGKESVGSRGQALSRIRLLTIVFVAALGVCAVLLLSGLIVAMLNAFRVEDQIMVLSDEDFDRIVRSAGLDPALFTRSVFISLLSRHYHFICFANAILIVSLVAVFLTTWFLRQKSIDALPDLAALGSVTHDPAAGDGDETEEEEAPLVPRSA